MATNERNQDQNRPGLNEDLNKTQSDNREHGNNPSGSTQSNDREKENSGEEDSHDRNRTTNPSAQHGYDANRDRNKYDDYKQPDQDRGKQDPTGRNRQL